MLAEAAFGLSSAILGLICQDGNSDATVWITNRDATAGFIILAWSVEVSDGQGGCTLSHAIGCPDPSIWQEVQQLLS